MSGFYSFSSEISTTFSSIFGVMLCESHILDTVICDNIMRLEGLGCSACNSIETGIISIVISSKHEKNCVNFHH